MAVSQAENYNLRGKSLAKMTLYEYVSSVVVKEIVEPKERDDGGDDEKRGRPRISIR